MVLRDLKIAPCKGCFHCWIHHPGICDQDDDSKVLTRRFVQSGLLAIITPVRFGGYGSRLKRVLERAVLPFVLPFLEKTGNETHHSLRYGRLIPLAALGGLPEADSEAETLFTEILGRNALNLHSPSHAAAFVYDHMSPDEMQIRVSELAEQVNTP